MLLVTGPTGSGKTTTVYIAALSETNDGLEKIVTIEDPVEYELPGVLQIPVNEQKGLTFATGLRSILAARPRQDSVGEIRDAETAEIAVQSALTGHLVFTTVHANSLFDVLGRFQHFSIDPFALVSATEWHRRSAADSKDLRALRDGARSDQAEQDQILKLGIASLERVPAATGCAKCRDTGYRGRFVVAEVHEIDDAMRDHIVNKTSVTELKSLVYRNGDERLVARRAQSSA